jgi:hypothetical protein
MKVTVLLKPNGFGLKLSAVFFAVCALVMTLLSIAPGAPAVFAIALRSTAAIFAVASIGIVGKQPWATVLGVVGGGLGVLTAVGSIALVAVFIFSEALAVFAAVLLVGSGFALGAVLLNRRRQSVRAELFDELRLLESKRFLITTAIVIFCVFVIIPVIGASVWSLFGCAGRISSGLCA